MIGTFAALDLVLFYVFYEAMLIPMYLLIGIWGSENRIYATVKFFLYTFAASVLMLVAILYVYFHDGGTFDYVAARQSLGDALAASARCGSSGPSRVAFAVKVPMFPLHTWLPDAHTEAPTAGSVILAGVLLKMGTFGFFRYALPALPRGRASTSARLIAALAVVGIVYGALMSLRADRHEAARGLLLGLPPRLRHAGDDGDHRRGAHRLGLPDAEPRRLHGRALPPRRHAEGAAPHPAHRRLRRAREAGALDRDRLRRRDPLLHRAPGHERLRRRVPHPLRHLAQPALAPSGWFAALGATGVILGAVYMLSLVQRVFFGKLDNPENHGLPDLTLREAFVMAPILALIGVMGLVARALPAGRAPVGRPAGGADAGRRAADAPGRTPGSSRSSAPSPRPSRSRSPRRYPRPSPRPNPRPTTGATDMVSTLDLSALLPFILLVAGALTLMLSEVFLTSGRRAYQSGLAVLVAVAAAGGGRARPGAHPLRRPGGLRRVLGLRRRGGLRRPGALGPGGARLARAPRASSAGEYYALALFGTSGMVLLAMATDLLVAFIAIEVMSLAVYALAAYPRRGQRAGRGGLQVLHHRLLRLGALPLRLGAHLRRHRLHPLRRHHPRERRGAARRRPRRSCSPAWPSRWPRFPSTPGRPTSTRARPTPVTAFMAAGVKAAAFAVLARGFLAMVAGTPLATASEFGGVLGLLAVLSMVVGNLFALPQRNVKRMLAYSSIAHAGYLLVGVLAAGAPAGAAGRHLGRARLPGRLRRHGHRRVRGGGGGRAAPAPRPTSRPARRLGPVPLRRPVAQRTRRSPSPWRSSCCRSPACPPTAGFVAKLSVFQAAVEAKAYGLAVVGVLTSVLGAYYYLRVVVAMYMRAPEPGEEPEATATPVAVAIALAALAVVALGIGPGPLASLARAAGDAHVAAGQAPGGWPALDAEPLHLPPQRGRGDPELPRHERQVPAAAPRARPRWCGARRTPRPRRASPAPGPAPRGRLRPAEKEMSAAG